MKKNIVPAVAILSCVILIAFLVPYIQNKESERIAAEYKAEELAIRQEVQRAEQAEKSVAMEETSEDSPIFTQSESDFRVSMDLSGEGVVIDRYLKTRPFRSNDEEEIAKVVIIPSKIQGFPVREIGYRAFYSSQIISVTIPEGVTKIGREAFMGCMDLTSITLPSTLKPGRYTIGESAFKFCFKLSLPTQAALRKLGYEGSFGN